VGRGNAFVVAGHCHHPRERIARLGLRVGTELHPAGRTRLPRAGVYDALPRGEPARRRAYRSGFVATATLGPVAAPASAGLALSLELDSGARSEAPLGTIELRPELEPPAEAATARFSGTGGAVAICMATHEPSPDLFGRQIASIREQTHRNWVCLISDDGSSAERLGGIREQIAGDARFVLAPSPHRLGFYANFERALSMVPADAEFVALSDQDDTWHPDKLERLLAGLGAAELVYSDARVVDPTGTVVRDSFWSERRNNWTNFASLLVANTVTGASLLCRRELLEDALPFPVLVGRPFHDHWLACVALARGELAYVDAPLYDYVQHPSAVIGHSQANRPGRGLLAEAREQLRGGSVRGREIYFYDWQQLRLFAEVIRLRLWPRISADKRRALRLLLSADSSAAGLGWLVGRRARRLLGRDETLDRELFFAFGLLTMRTISAAALGLSRPVRPLFPDARVPPRRRPRYPAGPGPD
jgi:glycosyltransferase involved in cell wall biosynthesis